MPQGGNWQNPVAPPLFLCYNELRGNLKMSIKLVLLKTGETIISDLKELVTQDSETGEKELCGYLFNKPHKINTNRQPIFLAENESANSKDRSVEITLSPWILLTKDEDIPITKDIVVTVVEPIDSIVKMYENKLNGKTN